jgi:hypothetical protein
MNDLSGRNVCYDALDDLSICHRIDSAAEYCAEVGQVTMSHIRSLLEWMNEGRRWTLIVRP